LFAVELSAWVYLVVFVRLFLLFFVCWLHCRLGFLLFFVGFFSALWLFVQHLNGCDVLLGSVLGLLFIGLFVLPAEWVVEISGLTCATTCG
jgi:hypothetical protein